jgi:hypothetical protein
MLTSQRVLSWHGRCVHDFGQINPVRWLAFALVLSLCNGPPFPAFADSGGSGAKAPAVRTARGWAAGLSPGDMDGVDFSDRNAARAAIAAKLNASAEPSLTRTKQK